jgi:hypothetical protein
MTHGTSGWHPTTAENVLKLQRVQNRASRFIYSKNRSHDLDSRIMSVKQHLMYIDLLYFYKCTNGLPDTDIAQTVSFGRLIRGQEGVVRLIPPKVRTTFYQKGFLYRSVCIWISYGYGIPATIKLAHANLYQHALKQYCLITEI